MYIHRKIVTLSIFLLLVFPLCLSAGEELEFNKAVSYANKGQFALAIAHLRKHLKKEPDRVRLRQLLGNILDHIGKPEEAVVVWEEGLQKKSEDYPLLMAMAGIRKRQGDEGPNVTHSKGMVSYEPSTDEKAENEYKRAHLLMAADLYVKAALVAPEAKEPVRSKAEILLRLKKFDEAVKLYAGLFEKDATDVAALQALAQAYAAAGKKEDAFEKFQTLLELDPRHGAAHAYLAGYFEAQGERNGGKEKAAAHRMQAEFFNWLAPFATMTFTKERFATFQILAQTKEKEGERRELLAQTRRDRVEKLIQDGSKSSLEFLATLCFHHGDHGPRRSGIGLF